MCKSRKNNTADGEENLPFPDTDLSPAAQQYVKEQLESGEDEGVDRDEFFRLLGKTTPPEPLDPE